MRTISQEGRSSWVILGLKNQSQICTPTQTGFFYFKIMDDLLILFLLIGLVICVAAGNNINDTKH